MPVLAMLTRSVRACLSHVRIGTWALVEGFVALGRIEVTLGIRGGLPSAGFG
jgi:hypothetical protein